MKSTDNFETHNQELAREYQQLVLNRDKRGAVRLILDSAESGIPVQELYIGVLQPVQREIGNLWQNAKISVAQEHYCTAVTQLVMSQLYSYIFTQKRNGHRMVMTCVGGELHEVGARMVADLFELDGWDTYYMGANAPTDSILSAISDNQAELLGVSVTMNYGIVAVRKLIKEIRSSDDTSHIRILVGGRPFLLSESLWGSTGADSFAPDAEKAVAVGRSLISKGK